MMQSAITIVVVIFLMIGIGFLFERKGWLGANVATVLSRVTLRIGMPALVFSNILTHYDRAMLLSGAFSMLLPLAVILSMFLFSALLVRWLSIPKGRQSLFRALFSFGNCIFLGMPVCIAIFGAEAASDVLLYYLVNTILWWTIGAPNVAKESSGKSLRNPIKRLASPPLVACLVSLVLVLLNIKPPEVLMTTAGYLGGMVTPLSMLFIGVTLSSMLAGGIRWQKGYGAILLGRCLIGPAIALPLGLLMQLPAQAMGVFLLQSAMPTQTQSCLWAQEHGGDAGYAAGAITLSTLIGLVAIPFYTWVFGLVA